MNIAQKMLKFQAETSLFLMSKTKQRGWGGGERKDEKKDRKKREMEKSKSKYKDVEIKN